MSNSVLLLDNFASCMQDPLSEKLNSLLKDEFISTKVEASIHYLYKGKVIPFVLSEIEEEELFKVMKKVTPENEAFVILKDFISDYGLKSEVAKSIFNDIVQSCELQDIIRNEELLCSDDENSDSLTPFLPVDASSLKLEEVVSDDDLKEIIKEVEEMVNVN